MTAKTTWARLSPIAFDDPVVSAVDQALTDPSVYAELSACEAREVFPHGVLGVLRDLGVASLFAEADGEPSRLTVWHAAWLNAAAARLSGSLAITLGVNYLALLPICIAGTREQRQRYFARIRAGGQAALLLTEWSHGSDLANISTRAHKQSGGYVLSGQKDLINGGHEADLLVTLARTGEPASPGQAGELGALGVLSLFAVERGEGVVSLPKYRTLAAPAADISGLRFADVSVPERDLIGGEGRGFSIVQQTLSLSRGGIAALAAGAANRAFELAAGYARRRHLYGAPLAELDPIADHLANLCALDHLCTALAVETAALANTFGQGAAYFTAVAKLACCELAEEAVAEGRKILAARALMSDLPYAMLSRDVLLYAVFDGTRHVMLGHLDRFLARMASGRDRSAGADPLPEALATAPARLVDVAPRRARPLLPSIAGRLEALGASSPGASLATPVAAGLLQSVEAMRSAGDAWHPDPARRFEAAEILAGLEAVAALAALGGESAATRYAIGWYGARLAARLHVLLDRIGAPAPAGLDAARQALARSADAARPYLLEELRQDQLA
jgi:alkylation response protein AidB-like acyl-CoA dehydrogenase